MDQVERDLLLFEEEFHDLVGEHREGFEHPLAGAVGGLLEIGGDRLSAHRLAFFAVEVDGFEVDEVDDALEIGLASDGDLDRDRGQAELAFELLDDLVGVRAGAVHLVDERQSRDVVPLHLPVDGDRL